MAVFTTVIRKYTGLMSNIKTSSAYRHASADGVVRLEFNFDGIYPSGS